MDVGVFLVEFGEWVLCTSSINPSKRAAKGIPGWQNFCGMICVSYLGGNNKKWSDFGFSIPGITEKRA